MTEYEAVIGLEIHIQLNTKKKVFCECENDPYNSLPNANVCPVCLGLPGALPVVNKQAILLAQKFAKGVGSNLNKRIVFERKNYFYRDLPKGFQITCPHYPISTGGSFDMSYWQKGVFIRFREIHLEEDTAKSIHDSKLTLLDFNKSGVPLLEIVTEPDFHDVDIAVLFCKEIQLIARYLGVSEASMQKGQMRLEANISVRKKGSKSLPDYRVELKNINSFNFMKKAVAYELRRQVSELKNGNKLFQETRGFDEKKNKTYVQRAKEEANDYRYFPEPDIPPIEFDDRWMNNITTSYCLLPNVIRQKLLKDGVSRQFVDVLVASKDLYEKYEQLLSLGYPARKSADLVINELSYKNLSADEIDRKEKEKKISVISSEDDLKKFVSSVLKENKKTVSDYKNGNENAIKFLMGQVMKKTAGRADPKLALKILKDSLK